MIARLENVSKIYDSGANQVKALKGMDFGVEKGEFVSIMGPSGSGKTILLNILGLLDQPTHGRIILNENDVTNSSDRERTRLRRRSIGFIFQEFHLIPTLTAKENVKVPSLFEKETQARNTDGVDERATDLLESVDLGERTEHYPDELSGGQSQRVAIARALINSPSLILADEPTGNLDRETGQTVLNELSLACDEGVSVVSVTHDPLVSEYADRTVHIRDGEIRDEDSMNIEMGV